jgi:hypothetical protein
MKKMISSHKFITLIFLIFGTFAISSCSKEAVESPATTPQATARLSSAGNVSYTSYNSWPQSTLCGTPTVATFYAGQNTNVGSVTISNSKDSVFVTYTTSGGWVMGNVHLYVGALANVPLNGGGNPVIGNFPYTTNLNSMGNLVTFAFPESAFSSCFIVAAHADVYKVVNGAVVQTETAWGGGTRFTQRGSWATYSNYCKQSCPACVYSTSSFDIFAGQTTDVGDLKVTNDQTNLYVTFTTVGDWFVGHTHLYVGTLAGLPINNANTPIPGQFPYSTAHTPYVQSYTYTIPLTGLPSCLIIAAHSEAHRVVNGTTVQSETAWSYGTQFPNTNRWGWYSSYCIQVCN